MWSEPFSQENLRRIFDFENRKGIFLEKNFFHEVYKETQKIKECNIKLKTGGLTQQEEEDILNRRAEHSNKKEELLTNELENISKQLTKKDFKITLRTKLVEGTTTYPVLYNAVNYFAIRQLQYNFQRFYKVKQSSSFTIVSQLIRILADDFPKYIIRTDIKDFYESIPNEVLFKKVQRDNLLDLSSKQILRQILSEYERLSGSKIGIPRGVGVSAYLAELYMRDFDEQVKLIPNLLYYGRYVDDIMAIFVPQSTADPRDYLEKIDRIIIGKRLTRNPLKTIVIDLIDNKQKFDIEYLGYSIKFGAGSVDIELSRKKIEKYKARVDLIFEAYKNLAKVNEKQARKILVKRLRFLTGNTRLINNKRNILVGIYFSNSLVNNSRDFFGLDKYLEHKIETEISKQQLRDRIKRYKFSHGFSKRRFSSFKTHELSQIINLWQK